MNVSKTEYVNRFCLGGIQIMKPYLHEYLQLFLTDESKKKSETFQTIIQGLDLIKRFFDFFFCWMKSFHGKQLFNYKKYFPSNKKKKDGSHI